MKRIVDYMTAQPWSVQLDDSVTLARRMLAERAICHLPVLEHGRVVGMVTERDLAATTERAVADVMSCPSCIDVDAPLAEALEAMVAHQRDAVVVTDRGRIAGIFTAMDAASVLRDVLTTPASARRRVGAGVARCEK